MKLIYFEVNNQNDLINTEADAICGAGLYERSPDRQDIRIGNYPRKLITGEGELELQVPRFRSLPFETQIIERYKRRESSLAKALVEMYLAGVSVRRVEDITEALWGAKVSASTVNEQNQKIYSNIEEWQQRPFN
ncbi:transposase [Victivallis sp. Marseille-Q1083]|uniref:transposase n=1 Tax=Victivallis sp. Marseille-Q1083 TaxID=2717288 RepID=UPI00158A6741|nr:transposase [Victivallis sp. Marseille-Q1083]